MNLKKLIFYVFLNIALQPSATAKSTPYFVGNTTDTNTSAAFSTNIKKPFTFSHAQLVSPLTSLQQKKNTSAPINIPIGIYIHLKKGWHSYWKQPGESGKPLKVQWQLPEGWEVSPLKWPLPERFTNTPNFKKQNSNKAASHKLKPRALINFGYKKSFLLQSTLFLREGSIKKSSIDLSAKISWLICKDVCIPMNQNLKLSIPLSPVTKTDSYWTSLFNKNWNNAVILTPQIFSAKNIRNNWQVDMKFSTPGQKLVNIFPLSFNMFSAEAPEVLLTNNKQHIFTIKKSKNYKDNQTKAIVVFKRSCKNGSVNDLNCSQNHSIKKTLEDFANTPETSAYEMTFKKYKKSILWFLLLAFLGGFILNLMPCVLPIVFLKFSNTLEQIEKKPMAVILSNILYSLGVIISFLALAFLLIGLKTAGQSIGWGFQMQSPYFLISITLLFILISFNFMGWFSIILPSSFHLFHKGTEHFKSFLTGVLSTTAASPCTVPFMGAAVGYALKGSTLDILLIFVFLGLGMSSPYLLLSMFPQWIRYAPHPGAWSEKLKHFMAFPMLATSAWLIHLLNRQQPDLLLPLLLNLLLLGFGFYLINNTQIKWLKRLAKISIILAIIGAFFSYSYHQQKTDKTSQIEWQTFSTAKLNQLRSQGQPLFINFTADWCLTCKWNEQVAFKNKKVVQLFKNKKIQALTGDWTHKNQEITDILDSYSRSGIPFYLYFPEGVHSTGSILPEWLTPGILIQQIK